MKSKTIRLLALVMALCMALTFTACGSSDEPESSAASDAGVTNDLAETEESLAAADGETEGESSAVSEVSEESEYSIPDDGKYDTLEEFIASDIMQDQIESMKASIGDTMDIEITAEGNTLIYTYTYPEGTETEGLGDALLSALDSQASTFGQVASSLGNAVDITGAMVKVIYMDAEGNELASRSFSEADASAE